MRNITFKITSLTIICSLLFCGALFAQPQIARDNFEGNSTIFTWFGDNCLLDTSFNNPYPSGINTSSKVLKYADVGGQYANVRFDTKFNLNLSVSSQFSLKLYVPSSGITGNQNNQISLKLQNGLLTSPWETQCEIIKPIVLNQWQTITFDFATDPFINLNAGSPNPIDRSDFNRVLIQINGENNNSNVLAFVDDFLYVSAFSAFNNLVWSDEFDSNGAVNTSNWFHQTQLPNGSGWYNGELQHYTNNQSNSFVSNGVLNIVAKKETFTDQGQTKQYTSARLNSKFAFKYGRVEVRAKLPTGAGTWPAIWMLGKSINEPGGYWQPTNGTTNWPACGEIDIMEHWGTNQNVVSSAIHFPVNGNLNVGQYVTNAQYKTGVSSDFHIYAVEWNEQKVVFSVDGVNHLTYNPSVKNQYTWPFDAEQYILLNVAIEPSVANSFVQSAMEVDYVRVYQKACSPTTSNSTISACGSYSWNGNTYTTSGTYTYTTANAAGCDSTATLNLTIHTSTNNVTTQTACGSYTWATNGQTYTTSGTYIYNYNNANGCASADTLQLTINPATTITTQPVNASVCTGNAVSFALQALGSGLQYQWYLVPPPPSSVPIPITPSTLYSGGLTEQLDLASVTPSLNGNTYVCAISSSVCGTTTYSNSVVLTVNEPTSSSTNASVCSSQLPYSWNGLMFTDAGTQTKTGLTNVAGCDSSATLVLTVSAASNPSVLVATASNSVCAGTVVTFTATPTNGGTSPIYQWKKNGANVGSNSNQYTDIALANNDSVWCVVTSNSACASTTTATSNKVKMTVKANPSIGVSYLSKTVLCSIGATATANNTNTLNGGVWTSSNTSVVTVANNSAGASGLVTAMGNGNAILTYTKTNFNGCTTTASVAITVAVITTPTITNAPASMCKTNTITLISNTAGGVWSSLNNAATINTSSGFLTAANAGTASIKYTITDVNGCKGVASASIQVNSIPAIPTIGYAPGTVNPQTGGGGAFCNNKNFTLVGTPSGGSWSSTGGMTIDAVSGAASTVSTGAASVTYTITNAGGCSNSRTITGNVVTCASRGLATNEKLETKNEFTMYPNPARNVVSLLVDKLIGNGQIVVTDLYGKQIKTQPLSMGTNTIDVSKLSKGMYFMSVITSEGKTTKKLVME